METIPEITNILGVDVKTVYDDPTLGNDALGYCDYDHGIILLKKMMDGMIINPQQISETYLHEIMHYIDTALELNIKELQIRRLSVCLYSVLHNNKIVF